MSSAGELVSAVIQVLDEKMSPTDVLPVLFNPEKYDLSKSVKYGTTDIAGLTTPVTQFASGDAETLSMELFFDTSEQAVDVRTATEPLDRLVTVDGDLHAPPRCRFVWGSLVFKAVVESMDKSFTKFLPTGQPVRARVNVTFREYRTPTEQRNAEPRFSPDTTTVREVTGEETLWLIADEEYGDPSEWRRIAEANDIANPRDLESGRTLVVPEL
jgi:nucleoid-associated protein YgaU